VVAGRRRVGEFDGSLRDFVSGAMCGRWECRFGCLCLYARRASSEHRLSIGNRADVYLTRCHEHFLFCCYMVVGAGGAGAAAEMYWVAEDNDSTDTTDASI
jgi:hypothetical protein